VYTPGGHRSGGWRHESSLPYEARTCPAWLAFIVALVALLFLGALMVQVRGLEVAGKSRWTRFADGTDVCGPRH